MGRGTAVSANLETVLNTATGSIDELADCVGELRVAVAELERFRKREYELVSLLLVELDPARTTYDFPWLCELAKHVRDFKVTP